jgi:spatacsin
MHVHVPWESQFEYFIAHNDVEEASKLLDAIPDSVLLDGILRVNVASSQAADSTIADVIISDYNMYIYDSEELEPVCLEIPHIKILRSLSNPESTSYIGMLMQKELAEKHIFLKEYWQSMTEIIPVLARSGTLIKVGTKKDCPTTCSSSGMPDDACHLTCEGALHKLVICFCVQYNLPYLLDLYLDNCNLALEKDCILLLKDAAVSSDATLVRNTSIEHCYLYSSLPPLTVYSCGNLLDGSQTDFFYDMDFVRNYVH